MMRLHDSLDYSAREYPDRDFAVMEGARVSYASALERVNRTANALIDAGLETGDRVAFLSKNSVEYALFYYAASKAGVVPVPLNYRLAAPEWEFILNDAGAKLVVAQPEFAEGLGSVRAQLKTVRRFLCANGSAADWDAYDAFVASGSPAEPDREIDPAADVYQMYTSGTTGRPKGAVLQHRAVMAQLQQATAAIGGRPGERTLIVAPMYHAAAALATFVTVIGGGTLYIQADFVPGEAVRAMSEEDIVMALLVPAMIQACLVAVPDVAERSYAVLDRVIYGASPIAEETLRNAIDAFGCGFIQGYGMTELTAVATYLMPQDHRRALAGEPSLLLSAGRAAMGTRLRIMDEAGNTVPNGTIGEVCVRGPQMMRCYWNRPDATEESIVDGWMHTGDAGILDDEGFLYIQDRVKDMIVSGAENVYPREIEDVLFQFPGVADAAVIGVPDEKFGEAVKAIIVCKEGAEVDAGELIAFCRERLAGYKQPRSVDFIDELPRNPSGKVMKKDLREPYWAGHDRRVG